MFGNHGSDDVFRLGGRILSDPVEHLSPVTRHSAMRDIAPAELRFEQTLEGLLRVTVHGSVTSDGAGRL